jgi:hypothetical protein
MHAIGQTRRGFLQRLAAAGAVVAAPALAALADDDYRERVRRAVERAFHVSAKIVPSYANVSAQIEASEWLHLQWR